MIRALMQYQLSMPFLCVIALSAFHVPTGATFLPQYPEGEIVSKPSTLLGTSGGNITITVEQYPFYDLPCWGKSGGTYTGVAGECNKFAVGPATAYWTFTMTTCKEDGSVSIYLDSNCDRAVTTLRWKASDYGKCIGAAVSTCQGLEASLTTQLV
eukprot:gnl/TRDRNA2_/TRDRNA2_202385_c0_seq1.p2 gnl/TRDRNA2_/TRDRNA2_202385_c0~~gnl/TRDRNA2_/TRDRNA2_202385_c0_seq1.p2  ORF type:complete len:155 (+),score=8.85 gnl/TRDRNA2_/TRDRNA2_202385_c0_seq1:76-540(+)